jgi:hypothetical protein
MNEGRNGAHWNAQGQGLANPLARGTMIKTLLPHCEPDKKPAPHEPVPLVREIPAADPYPVDGLGPQLAAVVVALNDVVQSPLAMCANSVLATVTLAAQGQINVELPIGAGSTRPVSGFFITVGRSGERKSASDQQIGKALKSREAELRQIHDAEMKIWRNEHDAWEAARKAILAGKQDKVAKEVDLRALGDEPEKPLAPIIIMEEPTVEGLAKLLMAGQPSVGVFSTEGGQFVGGHAMSDDAKLRSAAALSRLWDGDPWKRVRSGDGAHIIADKRLAMHLMVQPDAAAQLVNDPVLRDQGLVSRMLVTFPETTMGTRLHHDPAPVSMIELARFSARMTTALALPYPLRQKSRNDLAPRTVRLSVEARAGWIAFADHVERMIGPGGQLEPISGFAAKMAEHAARMAAAMAWWSDHDAIEIDAETLSNAIQLVEHYADEALRLWQASVVPADIADAQRLLDWLDERWSESHVSIADISRLGPNAVRVAQRARQLVKVLEEHHWLVKASGPVLIGGQRRREAWQVKGRV